MFYTVLSMEYNKSTNIDCKDVKNEDGVSIYSGFPTTSHIDLFSQMDGSNGSWQKKYIKKKNPKYQLPTQCVKWVLKKKNKKNQNNYWQKKKVTTNSFILIIIFSKADPTPCNTILTDWYECETEIR